MTNPAKPVLKFPDKRKILLFLTLQVLSCKSVVANEEENLSEYIIPTSVVSHGNAQAPEYFKFARRIFNSMYTTKNSWALSNASLTTLKNSNPFHIYYEVKSNRWDEASLKYIKSNILKNIFPNTFVLYIEEDEDIKENKYSELAKISKEGSTLACSFQYGEITTSSFIPAANYESGCGPIFNLTAVQIWRIKFDFKANQIHLYDEDLSESILKELDKVFKEREEFLENHPEKNVLFHLNITNWLDTLQFEGMYCSREKLAIYKFFETLARNFSKRKIAVVFNSIMGDTRYPPWIGLLNPPPGVKLHSETFYPVLRNYPPSLSNWLGKIDPCIEKTSSKKIPKDGIPLNKSLSGVTFNVTLRDTPLSVQEMEMALQYVMHKFTRVEINLGDNLQTVKNLSTALKNIFDENSGDFGNRQFFVEVSLPTDPSLQRKYMEEVNNLVEVIENAPTAVLLGVHGCYNNNKGQLNPNFFHPKSPQTIVTDLRSRLKSGVKVGISLASCGRELEYLLANRPDKNSPNVDYLVCNGERIRGTTEEWNSNQYLDGFLVVRNGFQKLLPNIEAHFKIDISGVKGLRFSNMQREELHSAEILAFITDVSQFSNIYQMSYLLSPAFGDVGHQGIGWWKITNYSDLTKAKVFIDRETSNLENEQWRPEAKGSESKQIVETSSSWLSPVLWTTGMVGFIVMLIANVFLCLRMRKAKVLSEVEVQEFVKGKKQNREEILMSKNDYMSVGFDLGFEIPKVEFQKESSEILGKGNFGTVLKAKVRGNVCAVKVPNDDCSKDSFRSMLTEVKLLCFIGDHVNIIQFVGAYTKEIKNGVIQIATSLCENGSLLAHLRSVKENMGAKLNAQLKHSQLRELIQFSSQIASGMSYIGRKNIVHGDLSARNILLDENFTCKIADFGLSRKLYEYSKYVKKSQEPLPWRWMSYESLTQLEFTTKSDVWSFAVTLWEIFTLGDIPYPGLAWSVEFTDEILNGMRMPMPRFAPPEICVKIKDCWNIEPDNRPGFDVMKLSLEMLNTDYTVLNEI